MNYIKLMRPKHYVKNLLIFVPLIFSGNLFDARCFFITLSGFLIRVLFGATLLNIEVSNWLYLTIISISFYLGLGKRRNEIGSNQNGTRKVLKYLD